ncbi:MAG: hypothetical protein PSY12_05830, partial [bacterium]|nr:hypothetical protein [bacterium]
MKLFLYFGCAALSVTALSVTAWPVMAQDLGPLPVQEAGAPVAPGMVLPANSEITLRLNQDLSTKTSKEGSMFDLSVADAVMVDGYVVIPMNARAVGEVTWLTGKGAFGKSGKMNIELRYVEVAGRRVPITGSFRQEGEGNTAATIGGVLAAGVFAGFITGKTAVIPAGRELKAFTKTDLALALPRRAPPLFTQPAPVAGAYASANTNASAPVAKAAAPRGAMRSRTGC